MATDEYLRIRAEQEEPTEYREGFGLKAILGGLFVAYMGCGLAAGLLGQQLFPDRLPVLMGLVLLAAVAARVVELLFVPPPSPWPYLLFTLIESAYAALLAAPLALLVRHFLHPRGALGGTHSRSPLSSRWPLK